MKKVLLFLSVIALTLFASCSSSDDTSLLKLSANELNIKSSGDVVSLDITTALNWKIAPTEWITLSATEGSNNATIIVTVGQNPTSKPRTGVIVFSSDGKIVARTMVQQKGLSLTVDISPISFAPAGGTQSVNVFSSDPWTVEPSDGANWCRVTPTNGNGNGSIQVTADAYTEQMGRRAELIFNKGTGDESSIQVIQKGTKDTYANREVILYKSNTKGTKPVHLVIVGDGYIASDYAVEGGAFMDMAEKAVTAFFAIEPYKSHKDYFRISFVTGYSQEQGATVLERFTQEGIGPFKRNTLFNSVLQGGGSTGIDCDADKVFEYAKLVPGVDEAELDNMTILVGINLPVYAGTCAMYFTGRSYAMCPIGKTFTEIVQHEGGGHGFGRLFDEYRYYYEVFPAKNKAEIENVRSRYDETYGNNVDLTGDANTVRWKHFMAHDKYKSTVGLFEGAYMYHYGIWRAEQNSCMNNNIPYFNAPSREMIVRRIMKVAGEPFSIENFYATDIHNPPYATRFVDPNFRPLGAPIMRK